MESFTPEMLAKARTAKTPEELLAMAREADFKDFTEESAKAYFELLNPATGTVADEELENVTGGGCYNKGELVVTLMTAGCVEYICKDCGTSGWYSKSCAFGVYHHCSSEYINCYNVCGGCKYCKYKGGLWKCTNPKKRK